MDEQKLKDIKAPEENGELSPKRKRINTYIFTVISSIFNLAITIAIVFGLILLISWTVHQMNPEMTQEAFSKLVKPIMWGSVAIGIASSFALQNLLVKLVIKGFKLQDKLDHSFVVRYCGEKK